MDAEKIHDNIMRAMAEIKIADKHVAGILVTDRTEEIFPFIHKGKHWLAVPKKSWNELIIELEKIGCLNEAINSSETFSGVKVVIDD